MPACFDNEILFERRLSTPRQLWETASDMPFVEPSFFDIRIYHRIGKNRSSILGFRKIVTGNVENGLWTGGRRSRKRRHACFFSALNPQEPDQEEAGSSQHSSNQLRKVLYKHCRRLDRNCIYHYKLKICAAAQADVKPELQRPNQSKWEYAGFLFERKNPHHERAERTPCEQIDLTGRGEQPARPLRDEELEFQKRMIRSLTKANLLSSNNNFLVNHVLKDD